MSLESELREKLPANYKERNLLRDRIRESIPECPELEFKFILGKHTDSNDVEFVVDNIRDSDIVLIELVGHDKFGFNQLMEGLESGKNDIEDVLEILSRDINLVNFPEFYKNLIRKVHEKGKIIRSADIFFGETIDISYMLLEMKKFTERIKSEKRDLEYVLKEIEALLLLFIEAQLNRERRIDANAEEVITDILKSHKELLEKKTVNVSISIGLLHSPLAQAFNVRGEKTEEILHKEQLPLKNPIHIAYAYFLYTGAIPRELLIQSALYLILKRYLNIEETPEDALEMLRKASDDEGLVQKIYNTFISEDDPAEKLRDIVNSI